jgi:ABC-type transport system involved in cytochrome c biogenesis ATPase subunit
MTVKENLEFLYADLKKIYLKKLQQINTALENVGLSDVFK